MVPVCLQTLGKGMKHLSVLGSTGSIGCNVLSIVEMFPQQFAVKTLAAGSNVTLLARQIERFAPELAVVFDEQRARQLKDLLPAQAGVQILYGQSGYQTAAAYQGVDITVAAMVGAAGLMPALAAIEAGKTLALANKETLVMAGDYVMARAAEKKVDAKQRLRTDGRYFIMPVYFINPADGLWLLAAGYRHLCH